MTGIMPTMSTVRTIARVCCVGLVTSLLQSSHAQVNTLTIIHDYANASVIIIARKLVVTLPAFFRI